MQTLKLRLGESFGGEVSKAIVFVDELDRCRPDYAISYLETIKHVFNVKGMIFVLAIDYDQLSNSARALFGSQLDSGGYFSKFYHRLFNLEAEAETFTGLVEPYFNRYLEIEGRRMSGWKLNQDSIVPLKALVKGLGMTPRQIQEAFRIIGHTLSTTSANTHKNIQYGVTAGTALLSFLKVGRPQLYFQISRGEADHKEVLKLLKSMLAPDGPYEWWRDLYLTGAYDSKRDGNLATYFWETEKINDRDADQIANQFRSGWGRLGLIPEICRRIEEARSF